MDWWNHSFKYSWRGLSEEPCFSKTLNNPCICISMPTCLNLLWSYIIFPNAIFLCLGPPVNVSCNIFINSFGSIAETTMVRIYSYIHINTFTAFIPINVKHIYLKVNEIQRVALPNDDKQRDRVGVVCVCVARQPVTSPGSGLGPACVSQGSVSEQATGRSTHTLTLSHTQTHTLTHSFSHTHTHPGTHTHTHW